MTERMDIKLQRPWWRSRGAALGGAVVGLMLAAAAAVGIVGTAERSLRLDAETIAIDAVRQGVFRDVTSLQGRVVPRDTIYLDALEGGQVQRVLVQAGDRVAAGQPLVELRNTQLELEVLNQEGRLVESITQLQAYEKQLEQNRADNEKALAQIEYNILRLSRMAERREPLMKAGFISRESHDQVRDELDYNRRLKPLQMETNRRQEELRRQQAPKISEELDSLQQSLGITRNKLADLTVRSPAAGRLTAMDLKVGQIRNRGERLGEITLDTGFKVAATIDEFYLSRVRPGQPASAQIDGRPQRLRVVRVYPQVQNGVFLADLEFAGAQPANLTPGAAVQGRLALGADKPALLLPAGAFLERSGGNWALVVTADGRRAQRRAIRTGRRNADEVEVLEGLEAGERVITSDYRGLENVDRVDLKRK